MPDESRRRAMRQYQKKRSAARRENGLVSRTTWICETDGDAFAEAVRPFAQHARLMEGVNGTVKVPPVEMIGIIREFGLPYDPQEMVFLSRIEEHLSLNPDKRDRIIDAAHEIIDKHPDRNFDGVLDKLERYAGPAPHEDPSSGPDEDDKAPDEPDLF